MAVAAEMRRADALALEAACEPARQRWLEYYYAGDDEKPEVDRRRFHLPGDWRVGVRHFLAAGLPIDDTVDLVDEAMRGSIQSRTIDGRWRYYMGCCKNSLGELERRARALIDASDTVATPAHPSTTAIAPEFQEPTLDDLP